MNEMRPFKFWCQKVLPLVYDDSLSYYELLCKVVDYLNKLIVDTNKLSEQFNELYTYVHDYFDNLDVQEEINKKLDELVSSGRLDIMLSTFIPYVTPEMFGAVGDGTTDDTTAVLTAISTGIANHKYLMLSRKRYLVSNDIVITDKININGNGGTFVLNGCNGIVFNPESRVREVTLEGFNIEGIDVGKVGISLTNFVNDVLSNVTISKCKGTGIKLTGENFESKIDMVNISCDVSSNNVGVDCESTDVTFSRMNGLDVKTFIINKAVGNFYKDCHAWLYSRGYFSGSMFADVQTSACFDSCIVDTYETGFRVNPIGSTRFDGCNWICNTDVYNATTASKVPTFIEFSSTSGSGASIKLTSCWLSMPGREITNWFDSLARIFSRECLSQMCNCFISNCADNIYLGTHYSNTNPMSNNINNFRSNVYLPMVQVTGEALGETATGAKIMTLPESLRPSFAFNSVGGCRVAGSNNIKGCNYYVATNGDVYVTYDKGSDLNSNSFFFNFVFMK